MKKILIPITAMLISCNKSDYIPPNQHAVMEFKLGDAYYKFTQNDLKTYEAFPNCGLRLYEVTIYTNYKHFFKIDLASPDTLQPGKYEMGDTPTNQVAGTSTFWYQGDGIDYTAPKPFTITITEYKNHEMSGYFSGGKITNGVFNHLKIEEK
jgi:hypothetical protein